MLFPKYLYGLYKDVKRRCTKLVRSATSLDAYGASVLSMGFVDTADTGGLFIFNGPSPLLGGEMNFHSYLPLPILRRERRGDTELLEAIFQESLKTSWGTLLLTSHQCGFWFNEGNRCAYVEAVFRHWDELGSIGPRYTFGGSEGHELLEVPTMIQSALFHLCGFSDEEGRRTNWTELFHDMKSKWERRSHPGTFPPGRAGE